MGTSFDPVDPAGPITRSRGSNCWSYFNEFMATGAVVASRRTFEPARG
jgi:hypothetical protein